MSRSALLCALLACAFPPASVLAAQDPGSAGVAAGETAIGQHRVALVIGNSAYANSPLKNPVNDARAMGRQLRELGFEVVQKEDLKAREVGAALREFRSKLRPGSVALFFYAGHGLQIRGENYLPMVDAEIASEEDVPMQSLNLNAVLNAMEESKAGVNLVLLDACRNNPYARSFRSTTSGLARVEAPSGTLIHYATRPGSVAEDGEGDNGTYTAALLAQMKAEGIPVEQALKRVTVQVKNQTKGKQEPWMEGSLTGDFYFILQGPTQITVKPAPADADAAAWQAAESSDTAAAYQAYLAEYPGGTYAAAARIKLAALAQARPQAAPAPATPAAPPAAEAADPDTALWREVQANGSRDYYDIYLKEYPRGKYAALARAELKRIDAAEKALLARREKEAWESAKAADTEEAYDAYLAQYPKGSFATQATAAKKKAAKAAAARAAQEVQALRNAQRVESEHLAQHERQRAIQPVALSVADQEAAREAAAGEIQFARLYAGEFAMGAAADDGSGNPEWDEWARPQHRVRVGEFEIGYYEVTVGQFRKFVEATGYLTEAERSTAGCHVPRPRGGLAPQAGTSWRNPGFAQDDYHPVVCVSWNDVQKYIAWLNGRGRAFRLPSEAEWEFAARAGTTTPRPWSDTGNFFARLAASAKTADGSQEPPHRACRHANVADERTRSQAGWSVVHNCDDGHVFTMPGGYISRNDFKLYDVIGNAAEWTQDCWHPGYTDAPADGRAWSTGDCSQRVVRGGSWASGPDTARSAHRSKQAASYRAADLGFRLVRGQP